MFLINFGIMRKLEIDLKTREKVHIWRPASGSISCVETVWKHICINVSAHKVLYISPHVILKRSLGSAVGAARLEHKLEKENSSEDG